MANAIDQDSQSVSGANGEGVIAPGARALLPRLSPVTAGALGDRRTRTE